MLCTSTIGESPVTVIVSSIDPTLRSASTVAVNVPGSSTPARRKDWKPLSEKLTVYVPGLKSTMRYRPDSSVTALRTFSMSAGLDASTVTPGSTAPDESLTTPVIDAWACAADGSSANRATTMHATLTRMNRTPFVSPLVDGSKAGRL